MSDLKKAEDTVELSPGAHISTTDSLNMGNMGNVEDMKKKIDRLRGIIDKFPKCWRLNEAGKLVQDEPVVAGMTTWCADKRPFPHNWDLRLRTGELFAEHASKEPQYSSPAAATAATENPS